MSVYDYQKEHSEKIFNAFKSNQVVYDISDVGSGKTYSTSFLLKMIQESTEQNVSDIVVICPKTLKQKWKNVTSLFGVEVKWFYSYSKFLNVPNNSIKEKSLVVLDEGHVIRNDNVTSDKFFILTKRRECKLLVLSSTILDTIEQETRLTDMFSMNSDTMFSMNYKLNIDTQVNKIYRFGSLKEEEDSTKAYLKLIKLFPSNDQNLSIAQKREIVMKKIQRCIRIIHENSLTSIISETQDILSKNTTSKVVIVIPFLDLIQKIHDKLSEAYNCCIMNGLTSETERNRLIDTFNRDSDEIQIFITNARVGSVGIDLDDKFGNRQRTLIYLPTYSSIDLFQSIGRIKRTSTKSNIIVKIIFNRTALKYGRLQVILEDKMYRMNNYSNSSIPIDVFDGKEIVEQGPEYKI
jgi:superfamily II DNA or RNA helicase